MQCAIVALDYSNLYSPMDPPIEDSIVRTKQGFWLLGSQYVCEIVVNVPSNAEKSWEANGNTYCIRKSSTKQQRSGTLGDSESDRVYQAGTSAAVWNIGGTFIKVKGWRNGMQLESDTIKFVNTISSIPTPQIVYSWVDTEWSRAFLVVKAIEGQTLDQAWQSLSTDQHFQIASTVAEFCGILASSVSENLMTAKGNGIVEPFLTTPPPKSEPSWKPQMLGPFSSGQLQSYLSDSPVFENFIKSFYFYHADLGPSNVIVTENGNVVGIIDWESAAFYPKFWLGTKPLVSAGFLLSGTEREAWAVLLADALKREGFAANMERYRAWEQAIQK